jgi:hypothetical protein
MNWFYAAGLDSSTQRVWGKHLMAAAVFFWADYFLNFKKALAARNGRWREKGKHEQ